MTNWPGTISIARKHRSIFFLKIPYAEINDATFSYDSISASLRREKDGISLFTTDGQRAGFMKFDQRYINIPYSETNLLSEVIVAETVKAIVEIRGACAYLRKDSVVELLTGSIPDINECGMLTYQIQQGLMLVGFRCANSSEIFCAAMIVYFMYFRATALTPQGI